MDDASPKPIKMVIKLPGPKPDAAAAAVSITDFKVRPREVEIASSPAPSNASSALTRSESEFLRSNAANEQPPAVWNTASTAATATPSKLSNSKANEPKSRNVESVKQSLRNAGADKLKEKEKGKEKDREKRPVKSVDRDLDANDDLMDGIDDDCDEDDECLATPKRGRRPFALSRFADQQKLVDDAARLCEDKPTIFFATLCEFLKVLVKMDQFDIFGYPVTDEIAPGYSRIIRTPMDFSTMRRKIVSHSYSSLADFKSDVSLVCNNAMTYNTATTVFHKEARRLASFSKRILRAAHFLLVARKIEKRGTAESILQRASAACGEAHVPIQPTYRKLSAAPVTTASTNNAASKSSIDTPMLPGHVDPQTGVHHFGVAENDVENDIFAEVKPMNDDELLASVRAARNRLMRNGRLDALATASSTTGADTASVAKRARLAVASNRLSNGSQRLDLYPCTEDERNLIGYRLLHAPTDPRHDSVLIQSIDRDIDELHTLAYASSYSYAPLYDSGGECPLTAEQNAAWNRLVRKVRATYDSETGVETESVGYEFARSLEWYLRGCVPYAMRFADELLDTLTHGEHSKTMEETNEFLTSYRAVLDAARRPPTPPPPTPPPPPTLAAVDPVGETVDFEAILGDSAEPQSSWLADLPMEPPPSSSDLMQNPAIALPATVAQPPVAEQEDEATLASRIMNELEELEMFL